MRAAASSRAGGQDRAHLLVGRERHVREVNVVLEALEAGRGNLVLVAGDAGMGKTRLAEEAVGLARQAGVDTAWVTCWAEAGAPPFWPWSELLHAVGERPPDLSGEYEAARMSEDLALVRFRVFDAVWRELQAASRKQSRLLVIDDLHWADMPSLRLLMFLAPLLHDVRLVVLATYRDAQPDLAASLGAVLPDLVRYGRHLVLPPLTAPQLAEFVNDECGVALDDDEVARLHWRTGGNPLFARELVMLGSTGASASALGDGAVPETVRSTLTQRLEQTSPACRRVLDVAAAFGVDFELDLIGAVAGVDTAALLDTMDEATGARLVGETGVGRFAFVHPLIREAAYQGLGVARRVRLHQQIGEALERRAETRVVDAAALAYHFRNAAAAGSADKALVYCEDAARRAMAMLAYEAAVAHYEDALASLALLGDDPARRTSLLLELGDAHVAAGDLASARSVFTDAAALARAGNESEELARAALGLGAGAAGFEVAQFDDAQLALLEEALGAVDIGSPVRPRLLARLSVAAGLGASDIDRRAYAEEAIRSAREAGDGGALACALSAHCDSIAGPAYSEQRLDEATEIVALAREQHDPQMELLGRRMRVAALLELGDTAQVDAEIDSYARISDAIRQPLYSWYVPLWRGMRALMEARFETASRWCADAELVGVRSHSDNALMLTTTLRMWLQVHRGEADVAYTRWQELMQRWPEYLSMTRPPIAITLWYAGRVENARAVLDQVRLEEVTEATHGAEWLPCLAMLGEVAGRLGGHALAPALYEQLLPFRDRFAIDGIGGHVVCCVEHPLALLARALDRDEAVAHFDAAIAAYERTGATLLLDQARADAGPRADGVVDTVARRGDFRRVSDGWIVGFGGRDARVRHTKGMSDIARLLAEPGREIHALDLMRGGGPTVSSPGVEAMDEQARAAYADRLLELDAELAEADDNADRGRSERLGAERDALLEQLGSAYGIGGRARRRGDSAERARSAVTQRVKDALVRIERAHPTAGLHLKRSLRTGTFCAYEPDGPVAWYVDLQS